MAYNVIVTESTENVQVNTDGYIVKVYESIISNSFNPTITSAVLGDILYYDGTNWINVGGNSGMTKVVTKAITGNSEQTVTVAGASSLLYFNIVNPTLNDSDQIVLKEADDTAIYTVYPNAFGDNKYPFVVPTSPNPLFYSPLTGSSFKVTIPTNNPQSTTVYINVFYEE